jgi:hypothetical protein
MGASVETSRIIDFQPCHFLTVTFSLYDFYTKSRFAMRLLLILAAVAAATAEYVPGKAFDRFITIWLENQVCARRVSLWSWSRS